MTHYKKNLYISAPKVVEPVAESMRRAAKGSSVLVMKVNSNIKVRDLDEDWLYLRYLSAFVIWKIYREKINISVQLSILRNFRRRLRNNKRVTYEEFRQFFSALKGTSTILISDIPVFSMRPDRYTCLTSIYQEYAGYQLNDEDNECKKWQGNIQPSKCEYLYLWLGMLAEVIKKPEAVFCKYSRLSIKPHSKYKKKNLKRVFDAKTLADQVQFFLHRYHNIELEKCERDKAKGFELDKKIAFLKLEKESFNLETEDKLKIIEKFESLLTSYKYWNKINIKVVHSYPTFQRTLRSK